MSGAQCFEERSHHIAIGLEYLPAVARRLYHSRELAEPFDVLTWFEHAPEQADYFERWRPRPELKPCAYSSEWEGFSVSRKIHRTRARTRLPVIPEFTSPNNGLR